MRVNDYLLFTFEGDPANPPTTHVGQIVAVDPGTGALRFNDLDNGQEFDLQLPADPSAPWSAQDIQGAQYAISTHNVYTAAATDPTPQGVALITFGDGNRALCYVESVSPTTDVVFYQQPNHRLSLEGDLITQSDWDAYPVGDQIVSIEGYVLDAGPGQPAAGSFADGWWSLAQQRPAFPGRIGEDIAPFAVVVHTTDMVPESWDDLVHSWTTQLGPGDAAHFLIGRDANAGILQLAPITKNANHAGGPGHGQFVAGQQAWHPNSVSVGIEVHCAGAIRQVDGDWHLFENGVVQGDPIPAQDVIQDPQRPGRGWHVVTDDQYEQLAALLDGLEAVLQPLPEGCVAQSIEAPPAWGVFPDGRRVGHVSLHAAARGDPWPPTCDWMRARRPG